jgi:hypothetical protein
MSGVRSMSDQIRADGRDLEHGKHVLIAQSGLVCGTILVSDPNGRRSQRVASIQSPPRCRVVEDYEPILVTWCDAFEEQAVDCFCLVLLMTAARL